MESLIVLIVTLAVFVVAVAILEWITDGTR